MQKLWKEYLKNRRFLGVLLAVLLVLNAVSSSPVLAARDKTPPSTPTNLHTVTITDTSVTLAWNASTDNIKVSYYEIYKDSVKIGTSTTATYKVSSLLPAHTYKFYVRARDTAGNASGYSSAISITTASSATPTVTPTASPTPTPTTIPSVSPAPSAAPSITPTAAPTPAVTGKRVIGYYAAWAAYSGFTPDKVDAAKLTHINYAFANIGSDLKVTLGYPDVDPANITKLNALKQVNPNLKTIISVGGWDWSGRFSDATLTDASRTTFADSCVAFIVKYGFDGVDIDWEYPVAGGLSTNVRRPEDKTNFTLMMQKLREKLDARGALDGKHYILSFAGAESSWYTNNIELGKLNSYVDYANVMTYDIHGSWDTYTDFNAPLYTNSDASMQDKASADSGITTWLNNGFPANKIVMGIPFYGYIYKAVTNANYGLYQTYSGASSISYANIAANYLNASGYVRHFHSQSMVPWLFNGSTFISYDDPESIGYKAQYIKSKGLGGAMIWELSQDPNRVLLNALYNGLK